MLQAGSSFGGKAVGEPERTTVTLTDEQRRLVRDNLGLVAMHLRRNVAGLRTPQRGREWEDLFQEGCLGLIRAATDYRPERGIPFAAFALPRIHNAVSRALQTKFSTIYTPPRRRVRPIDGSTALRRDEEARTPKAFEMSSDLADRAAHRRRSEADSTALQTIGERLRGKYERAVSAAAEAVSGRTSTRGDREQLVRTLVDDRFLVPDEESRRPLRGIARETRSSYGRVAECDRQLCEEVRRTLEADPEFHVLQRLSKTDPVGADLSIDENLERELAAITAAEFTRRFSIASRDERTHMLQGLLELSPGDLDEIVRTRVSTLPTDARERLLRGR